jgi:hypothetical protein
VIGAALAVGACGGSIDEGAPNEAVAGGMHVGGAATAGGTKNVAEAGKPAAGGSTAMAGAGGASGEPVNACARHIDQPPGEPIYNEMDLGAGECAGVALSEVIAVIRELRPDLVDVVKLYEPDPERVGDGSFIYAFRRADGGFAVVFKRGGGDCPAGCTINDYWYFETSAACAVAEIGEAHRDFEHCMEPDQLPRWGIPRAAQPSEICDADLSAQDISGNYELIACGHVNACWDGKAPSESTPLPSPLPLRIRQDPEDLSHGTVMLDGTGEPLLDGHVFDATFERRSFRVMAEYTNLPATCVEQWSLQLEYDLEGFGRNQLNFSMVHTPDCQGHPDDYCKGQVAGDLGDALREAK